MADCAAETDPRLYVGLPSSCDRSHGVLLLRCECARGIRRGGRDSPCEKLSKSSKIPPSETPQSRRRDGRRYQALLRVRALSTRPVGAPAAPRRLARAAHAESIRAASCTRAARRPSRREGHVAEGGLAEQLRGGRRAQPHDFVIRKQLGEGTGRK